MARLRSNSYLTDFQGRVGDFIYKRYKDGRAGGVVVSSLPDMSRVKPTRAQLAHRKRVADAMAFYRAVKKNPAALAKYRRLAERTGISIPAACLSAYFEGLKRGEPPNV